MNAQRQGRSRCATSFSHAVPLPCSPTAASASQEEERAVDEGAVWALLWAPLVHALLTLTGDLRENIHTASLEVLFELLQSHGATLSTFVWKNVADAILPALFGPEATAGANQREDSRWMRIRCASGLRPLCALVPACLPCAAYMLPRALQFLVSALTHPALEVATAAAEAVVTLLQVNLATLCYRVTPAIWEPGSFACSAPESRQGVVGEVGGAALGEVNGASLG